MQRLHARVIKRGVVVHVRVVGLQLLPAQNDSLSGMQGTHAPVPSLQAGVFVRCIQSMSAVHPAHVFVPKLQRAAAALPQSVFVSH